MNVPLNLSGHPLGARQPDCRTGATSGVKLRADCGMISSVASMVCDHVFHLLVAMCLMIGAIEAFAHQPYESSAVARLDHGQLELVVTTSAEIAGYLVGKPMSDAASLENLYARVGNHP